MRSDPPAAVPAERIAVAASNADCAQVGWHTPNVMACYGANGAKYYKRGANQTSLPPPHWAQRARLGQSVAQQVRGAGPRLLGGVSEVG